MDDFDPDFGGALVAVRADTQGFRREVEAMRRELADGLGGAADIAGRRIENALLRAVRTGKLGFDDLKRTALSIMAEIASAAVQSGLQQIFAGGGKGGAGGGSFGQSLLAIGTQLLSRYLGSPGRATGGPVAPGRAYMVGERGPELFVPTASGRVVALGGAGSRDVRLTININAPDAREPEALARSSRQVARAVKTALARTN
ncbi:tail tape measure protein [uncultured Parasphingopyxis sp.]|uniref:tail tape measure protein n=1 Tax=uncultured Parasphingopyxis sp. TaxID=1547918 RepID=UPI00260C0058|nr:tail tape measure protein [uncultured Parasphingopyxis sp.]